METPEILDCGHAPDPGKPYDSSGRMGWQWAYALDGVRKICHACQCAQVLDCGHPIGPHSEISTGYGTEPNGARVCFACCAESDRAAMIRNGRAVLYLVSRPNPSPATVGTVNRDARHWFVTNWPGSLEFKAYGATVKPRGGGFGSQRTDAYFPGPDGYVWHAVNRGDSQIARCRRTKEKTR